MEQKNGIRTAGSGSMTEEELKAAANEFAEECVYLLDDMFFEGFIAGMQFHCVPEDSAMHGVLPSKYAINAYRQTVLKNKNPLSGILGN